MKHSLLIVLAAIAVLLAACAGGSATVGPTPTIDPESDAGLGRTLFQAQCGVCHSTEEGVTLVGPSLAHVASRAGDRVSGLSAEDYLHDSIVRPDDFTVPGFPSGGMRQDFGQTLTSDQVNQLVAYLMSLQ
jgi:mono/diheme cytochrome c family protein